MKLSKLPSFRVIQALIASQSTFEKWYVVSQHFISYFLIFFVYLILHKFCSAKYSLLIMYSTWIASILSGYILSWIEQMFFTRDTSIYFELGSCYMLVEQRCIFLLNALLSPSWINVSKVIIGSALTSIDLVFLGLSRQFSDYQIKACWLYI